MSEELSLPDVLLQTGFSVKSKLGQGGQGAVWSVVDSDGKRFALKVVKASANGYSLKRMKAEIATLANLRHPNILRLERWDQSDQPLWHLSEQGKALQHWWKLRRRRLPHEELFDESVKIVSPLIEALVVLHGHGFVHRDIKPANVIMFEDTPVLADFGIVHDPDATRLTDRPAGNRFAPFVPSRYDPSFNPPFIDCLGIATLWAWLLAEDLSIAHGYYHWRYHRFVEDPRCEFARALLAACTHPEIGPANGEELRSLLESLGALEGERMAAENEPEWLEKIRLAREEARPGLIQEQADRKERIEAIAALLIGFDGTVERVRERVDLMHRENIARIRGGWEIGKETELSAYLDRVALHPGVPRDALTLIWGDRRRVERALRLSVTFPPECPDSDFWADKLLAVVVRWSVKSRMDPSLNTGQGHKFYVTRSGLQDSGGEAARVSEIEEVLFGYLCDPKNLPTEEF